MFELAKLAGYLGSPLTLTLGLALLAAVCWLANRRRAAAVLVTIALAGLWIASLPVVANALTDSLQRRYPALAVQETPSADAIVILGGALAGAWPPQRPALTFGPAAGRVWHAASLYRAGKAPWVVIAGGNQPGWEGAQSEADAIAEVLGQLGVPASAIQRESRSRNTLENAAYVHRLVTGLKARRVLLVTSAAHMPRAVQAFQKVWQGSAIELIPASTDVQPQGNSSTWKVWLPSLEALINVTKGLKEFAGMAALAMM